MVSEVFLLDLPHTNICAPHRAGRASRRRARHPAVRLHHGGGALPTPQGGPGRHQVPGQQPGLAGVLLPVFSKASTRIVLGLDFNFPRTEGPREPRSLGHQGFLVRKTKGKPSPRFEASLNTALQYYTLAENWDSPRWTGPVIDEP